MLRPIVASEPTEEDRSKMRTRHWGLVAILALLLAACSNDSGGDTGGAAQGGSTEQLVVGVSWNNYQEERWAKSDEPAIKAALAAAGARYISTDAGSSAEKQLTDVENLISQGAKALIILAQDSKAILPAVKSAVDQGIPVIAYDRLIEDTAALYVTFDNVEVGRMQAREIFEAVPRGNYVIIKGNQADPNADFLRSGYEEVIGSAVDSGDIKIVGETYTDNWDQSLAQTQMEQFLTQANNDVDAVLSENDGMAGGVVAALEAQGLAGRVPVSGQDGDVAALNRVALGTQTLSVWKDARELGKAAGEAAIQLARDPDMAKVPDVKQFQTPGGISMNSILLVPISITKENLNVVIDAGWITKNEVCQGVTGGDVAACQ
jgi:D-xylose transport system substrate-binding protein